MNRYASLLAAALVAALTLTAPAAAQKSAVPGTAPDRSFAETSDPSSTPVTRALDPTASVSGRISVSIDGLGSNAPSGALIQVEKPAGGTVRAAYYLTTADFGDIIRSAVTIERGGDALTLAPGDYDATARNLSGSNRTENGFEDVTAFVKPIVDAEPAGIIDFRITEQFPSSVEGNALVVIFDDPSVAEVGTFVLAFGSQQTTGDSFAITLGAPFDATSQSVLMSLGITFGFQLGFTTNQFSEIDVNGQRLTSSAGGQDDGESANAALVTVGGIGDDPGNPADPDAGPNPTDEFRSDDELYTLDDLIEDGTTSITVETRNPSNDDNIFFAAFIIQGAAAIVGEGILLTPTDAENPVGTDHTVTALVQDDDGDPVAGREVTFEVLSGPNAGLTAAETTDGDGEAAFTFSSDEAGTDVVVARFVDSGGDTVTSNEARKTWVADDTRACEPGDWYVSEFDADASSGAEYVDLFTAGPGALDLGACTFVAFSPFSERVTLAVPLDGVVLDPSETVRTFSSSAGDLLPDGPGAIAFVQGDVAVGATVASVLGRVAHSVVYRTDQDVFGVFPAGSPLDPSARRAGGAGDLAAALAAVGAEAGGLGPALAVGPNPVRGAAAVTFALDAAAAVRVSVYDVLGREVAVLAEGPYEAGAHRATLDASALPTGAYVVRLTAGAEAHVARVTVVR